MKIRKKTFIVSLLFLCVVALTIFSFIPEKERKAIALVDPAGQGSGYSCVLYDNKNGLPTSDVNAMVQTEEGFIWIGSYSGLIRYDGNEFYRYDSSTGVSSVVSLYVDSKNRLWIGTNDSGVFVMEDQSFRSYDRAEGLRSSSVRSILEDDSGNILVATTMGMAYVDKDDFMHAIDVPMLNQEYICELTKDASGIVYGVTEGGNFFTLEDFRPTMFDSKTIGIGTAKTIYPDPNNKDRVYIGTDGSTVVYGKLDRIKEGEYETISVAPQKVINSIQSFGDVLWICADNGIGFLENGEYRSLRDSLPMNNSVEHVLADFEQNLWFSSSRQGLMKVVRNRFNTIVDLAPRVVNSTYMHDGFYYIGTDSGLVIISSDYEQVNNALTEVFDGIRIRSIQGDSRGRMWFGTGQIGIVCYDPASGDLKAYNEQNGLAHKHARTMLEMSDGRIAVATKAGVNVIENGEVTELYNKSNGINNLEILCLEEGPNGELYVGSDGDGVYVISSGIVTHIGREDGLLSEVILRIRRDPVIGDLYWLVTSNSLAYLQNGKITTISGFPYSNNFDMYFDDLDRIWVLSSNGIYVVKRDILMRGEKIDYVFYDTSGGLPSAATANSYSYLGEDGILVIAASIVSSVNVNDTADLDSNVRLSVPFVMADERYIPITDGKAEIPSDCKRLTIYAYAFSYSLNNPHLTYSLNGFDADSISLTKQEMHPIVYTNLPGGEYTFRLAVINTMTGEEDQFLELVVSKKKTVYEQVWFWVVLAVVGVLLIVGVIVLFYQRKTKLLLKKERQDDQLIGEMTSVFAHCIDMKDSYTNGHSHRVAKYTAMIAERLGKSKEEVEKYYRIALLHDIGKIGIPDEILNKPGRLTDEEYSVMKSHSMRGYEILKEISIAPELAIGAGYHHERQDGKGYPHGIPKEEIPEVAQIIAVADTFDAMFSTRPYRRRMKLNDIVAEIKRCSGTQLNEKYAGILLELIEEGAFADEESAPAVQKCEGNECKAE